MGIMNLLINPLSPFRRALKKRGFYEITDSLKPLKRYEGVNFVALTNNKVVFVITDKWHDQQIEIELGKYPFDENDLVGTQELLAKFNLNNSYDYREITSYYDQPKAVLIRKQVLFMIEILNLINPSL